PRDPPNQSHRASAQGGPDVLQDVLLGDPFELDEAAERNVKAVRFYLLIDALPRTVHQRPEPHLPVVAPMRLSNEVQDGQAIFPLVESQPASELLQEDSQALGRAE